MLQVYNLSAASTDTSSKAITLTTNDFYLDDEVQYKKLMNSIFKGVFKGGSTDLVVTLQGKRKSSSGYIDLISHTITDGNEYEDLILKTNYGIVTGKPP